MNHPRFNNKKFSITLAIVVMGITAVVAGYFIGNLVINFAAGGEVAKVNTDPQKDDFIINDGETDAESQPQSQIINTPQSDYSPGNNLGNLFVVQLGAFNNKANAENLRDELLEKGYPSVIITEGLPYKVQLRASQTRAEAEQLKGQVKEDGYVDVFIVH